MSTSRTCDSHDEDGRGPEENATTKIYEMLLLTNSAGPEQGETHDIEIEPKFRLYPDLASLASPTGPATTHPGRV